MNSEKLIQIRREFRKIAEPGWLEILTTINIIKYLKEMGYSVDYGKKIHSTNRLGVPSKEEYDDYLDSIILPEVDFNIEEIVEGYTGAVAYLDTGNPGKTIGIRVDIDAIYLKESDDEEHRPNKLGFRSKNDNACHACGHDAHIAIGIGIAEYIMENKNSLKGKYVIIFQPAEEGVRGGKSITDAGVLDEVDYFMSAHIGAGKTKNELGVGTIGFLGTMKYDIKYFGIPTHSGSSPEKGRNALLAACSCALNLHTLPQTGAGMSRLNVGTLNAGTGRNVIPSQAKMQIEVRGENSEITELLSKRVVQVVDGASLSYDVKSEIEMVGAAPAFMTINPEFVDYVGEKMIEYGYNVVMKPSINGSEDVSYMMEKVEENGGKSIHYIFGTKLEALHHNDRFDYDEEVLELGVNAFKDTIKIFNELD
ncbi:MAG: M20 family metallo-hydrolase [Tissierellia bacterium]|nr:M20 family metallo-hydrolase [Tissierellia bacterium]